jgi:membrane associated rhomboid family serine protease
MIPLRDANPTYRFPFVNYTIIGINVLVFLFELSLGPRLDRFVLQFGVVPIRLSAMVQSYDVGILPVASLFTSMFLHGGFMHLLGNMWFLHIFGDNVEDRVGHGRYIIFYLLSGVAAALTQVVVNPSSQIPMVGASGAIAGVMGAYVFLYPHARVLTLVPIFFFIQMMVIPAYIFLGIWFLMQMLSGMMSLGIGSDAGGVAWWAHIGGFACGAVLLPFFRKTHR